MPEQMKIGRDGYKNALFLSPSDVNASTSEKKNRFLGFSA
jgi:hypothetical protein